VAVMLLVVVDEEEEEEEEVEFGITTYGTVC
jgi:hypothetical protein